MQYLVIAIMAIVIIALSFPIFRFINRKDAARMRRLHARTVALQENARRVHEQQEMLREQQRQQYPPGGPPPGPETGRR